MSGRHAAPDGAFGRSAGSALLRGLLLLVVALVLGIVLLQSADSDDPFDDVTAGEPDGSRPATTVTTAAPGTTTTTTPLRPPAEIKVLAANGTSTAGLAGRFKDRLAAAGYNALAPTDASNKPVQSTTVYFTAGYENEARVIGELLQVAPPNVKAMPQPAPVRNLQSANVLVVVGQDKVAAAQASTTTTLRSAPASTTTSTTRPT